MKTTFIYVLKDPETGEVRYVGKSNDPPRRLRRHCFRAPRESFRSARWVSSVLSRGFWPTLEIIDEVAESEWPQWEAAYIQFFRESGCELVNGTDGGDCGPSRRGLKSSPEHRRRISESLTGSKHPGFGTRASLQTREKMRAAGLARWARHREAQSAS